jgi:hypothetical protein
MAFVLIGGSIAMLGCDGSSGSDAGSGGAPATTVGGGAANDGGDMGTGGALGNGGAVGEGGTPGQGGGVGQGGAGGAGACGVEGDACRQCLADSCCSEWLPCKNDPSSYCDGVDMPSFVGCCEGGGETKQCASDFANGISGPLAQNLEACITTCASSCGC